MEAWRGGVLLCCAFCWPEGAILQSRSIFLLRQRRSRHDRGIVRNRRCHRDDRFRFVRDRRMAQRETGQTARVSAASGEAGSRSLGPCSGDLPESYRDPDSAARTSQPQDHRAGTRTKRLRSLLQGAPVRSLIAYEWRSPPALQVGEKSLQPAPKRRELPVPPAGVISAE